MPSHPGPHSPHPHTHSASIPAPSLYHLDSFKMSSSEVAALKEQGNALYLEKRYDATVRVYTQALELDPTNHVLCSNRCACSLRKEGDLAATTAALRDAIKCTELQPEWAKFFFSPGSGAGKAGTACGGMYACAGFWYNVADLHFSVLRSHETLDQVSPCVH